MKRNIRGVTLIALIVTIVVLLIIATIAVNIAIDEEGIIAKTKDSKTESIKQEATEVMKLKISNIQIESHNDTGKMSSLQYIADKLCEDDDVKYVIKKDKKEASLKKIDVSDVDSIFVKLKKYPYEFELDSTLEVALVDEEQSINSNISIKIEDDDLKQWISKLDNYILTLDDVINNRLLSILMNSKEAVDYMIENDRIIEAVLNSQNAIIELSKSDYASYQVYQKENLWNTLKKSEFFEQFNENRLISPILTSETSSHRVTVEGNYSESVWTNSWVAFSEDQHTSKYGWGWVPAACDQSPKDRYCRINFVDGSYMIYGYSLKTYMNANASVDSSIDIIANANGEWKSLKENIDINYKNSDTIYSDIIDSKTEVTGLGIKIVSPNVIRRSSYCGYTSNVKFYGFKIK